MVELAQGLEQISAYTANPLLSAQINTAESGSPAAMTELC